jgi:aminoglycoside phosphotransferase family enzyme
MEQPTALIQALLNPRIYPHPVEDLELRETPHSWIILTGHYAYKIKKPVKFVHLDYSTLTKRRYYCYAELRLNQRLAPDLYFDVSTITGSTEMPQINGHGPILEFAVKMRQVADTDRLGQRLDDCSLSAADFDRLGETIARLHRDADSAPFDTPFGHPDAVRLPALENFNFLRKAAGSRDIRARIETLERWCLQQHQNLSSSMLQRKRAGYVRECHANLQLNKIIVHDNALVPTDSLEYNDNLRWIDVIGDIACPMADLIDRGHSDYAYRLLNAYLQQTGDYPGLGLLPYYLVGRALARAAFAGLRHIEGNTAAERDEAYYELLRHLATAELLTLRTRPALIIMYGLPGSG